MTFSCFLTKHIQAWSERIGTRVSHDYSLSASLNQDCSSRSSYASLTTISLTRSTITKQPKGSKTKFLLFKNRYVLCKCIGWFPSYISIINWILFGMLIMTLSLLDKKVKTVHVSLSQELADSMSLKLSLDDKHLSSNASSNEITKKNQEASSGRISAMRI